MRDTIAPSATRRAAVLATAAAVLAPSCRGRAAEPVRFGQIAPLSGGGAVSGPSHVNGARLALEMVNTAGGVLGRSAELVVEDGLSTPDGAVAALRRFAERGDIAGVLGSTRSVEMHALVPEALKAGRPVLFGGTDPALTTLGNPWLFRCQPSDAYSARAMAAFGVGDLGKRNWAVLHSSDPFGSSGAAALRTALKALGAQVVLARDYPNQRRDFAALARAAAASDADVLASYVSFEPDQVAMARAVQAAGVRLSWIGSQFIASTAVLEGAGEALYGTYAVAAFHPDANAEARAFADRYARAFGGARADFFAAWPFDAVAVLARAINTAGTAEPGAVRDAILTIHGHGGAEGEFNFDAKGDGLHGYNVVRNDGGRIVFVRRFEFPA